MMKTITIMPNIYGNFDYDNIDDDNNNDVY